MKIETKLSLLAAITALAVAIFGYLVISERNANRKVLSNFEKATELVIVVSDLFSELIEEKHTFWKVLKWPDDPACGREFQGTIDRTDLAYEKVMGVLATVNLSNYSPQFQEAVNNSLSYPEYINPIRRKILGNQTDSDECKDNYNRAFTHLTSFFSALVMEVDDPDLIRKIEAQDVFIRMKFDLYYVRGSVNSAVENLRMNPFSRGKIVKSYENIEVTMNKIRLTANKDVVAVLDTFEKSDSYATVMELTTVSMEKGNDTPEALQVLQDRYFAHFNQVKDQLGSDFDVVTDYMAKDLLKFTQARVKSLTNEIIVGWVFVLTVLGISLSGSFFISRSIIGSILKSAAVLAGSSLRGVRAAESVRHSSSVLAEEASHQAAALEEISASLEEMSGMMKQNVQSISFAESQATQAKESADIGSASVNEMKEAMDEIQASSQEVSKIIKTIEEIAFQTNMLALNAAVEAARAGVAGAGFAVVAEEVRNLAGRSAKAAQQTATQIESAVERSQRGYEISSKLTEELERMVGFTYQFSDKLKEISTAVQESNRGTEQITKAVSHLDGAVQRTASSAQEVASVSEQVQSQSQDIAREVKVLEALSNKRAAPLSETSTMSSAATGERSAPVRHRLASLVR